MSQVWSSSLVGYAIQMLHAAQVAITVSFTQPSRMQCTTPTQISMHGTHVEHSISACIK